MACLPSPALARRPHRGRRARRQDPAAASIEKKGKDLRVLDPASGQHVEAGAKADASVIEILKLHDPAQKLGAAARERAPAGAVPLGLLSRHLSLHRLSPAGDRALGPRCGSGDALGIRLEARALRDLAGGGLAAGRAPGSTRISPRARPSPACRCPPGRASPERKGVHFPRRLLSMPRATRWWAARALDVYRRQLSPETVLGESRPTLGETVYENAGVRAFTTGDEILVVSFKTKAHSISPEVLEGLNRAIDIAEERFDGLVIWQTEPPFSVGANLDSLRPALAAGDWPAHRGDHRALPEDLDAPALQRAFRRWRRLRGMCSAADASSSCTATGWSPRSSPTWAWWRRAWACCRRAAAARSSRCARRRESKGDLFASLKDYYMLIATAKVAGSGIEAQELRYLRASDLVVFNPAELLHVARQQALAMSEAGYRPPLAGQALPGGRPRRCRLDQGTARQHAGRTFHQRVRLRDRLADRRSHDRRRRRARHRGGRGVAPRPRAPALPRARCRTAKTQERIAHTLATGKPLRN